MADKKHRSDPGELKSKHLKTGEACLTGHQGKFKDSDTCSYRWQAYLKAKSHKGLYNWPRYKVLHERNERIRTSARKKGGKTVPSWYKLTLKPPEEKGWDIGVGKNFNSKCYIPYWHEAHHVIPKGTLREELIAVGRGAESPTKAVRVVRGGLLDEGYNVNNKKNMIILPLDREVSLAIELPKHRKTPNHRSHKAYSRYAGLKLSKIFVYTKNDAKKHKEPEYKKCKTKLEKLSKKLYDEIVEAGEMMSEGKMEGDSIDDMVKSKAPKKKAPKGLGSIST
jgi:hypothetical protein